MSSEATTKDRIVVAVDGSETSVATLRWGLRQASLTGAPLTVLTTWHYPATFGDAVAFAELDLAADAKEMLDRIISAVIEPGSGVAVTKVIVEGHPSPVLVEESKDAQLIVVGSRGHGELTGMLLGSVSEFVATHAHCPVAIIRGDAENLPA